MLEMRPRFFQGAYLWSPPGTLCFQCLQIASVAQVFSFSAVLQSYYPLKPKFDDVCVLFIHSNFCSRMLEMRPRFFQGAYLWSPPGTLCFQCLQIASVAQVFSFSAVLQSYCHLLKALLKTLH